MRQSDPKPPRRPRAKSAARTRKEPFLEFTVSLVLALLGVLVFSCVIKAAVAAVPPIAAVGDQVRLTTAIPGDAPALRLAGRDVASVFAAPGRGCVLNTWQMAREGGVLTVVAVRPDGIVLSWAGGATAREDAGCRSVGGELILSQNDYATLLRSRGAKH
jgi:hypothetical protein